MATFALGAGNLIEILHVEESGASDDTRDLMYQVPTGFYAELVSFSTEQDGIALTANNQVDIMKRVTSTSDTMIYTSFLTPLSNLYTGVVDDIVPDAFDSIYHATVVENPDNTFALNINMLVSLKQGTGIRLYPGDEIRFSHTGSGGTDNWLFRATLHLFKNP